MVLSIWDGWDVWEEAKCALSFFSQEEELTTLPRREELHPDEQLCHDSLAPVIVSSLVPTFPFLAAMVVQLLFNSEWTVLAITLTTTQGIMRKIKYYQFTSGRSIVYHRLSANMAPEIKVGNKLERKNGLRNLCSFWSHLNCMKNYRNNIW